MVDADRKSARSQVLRNRRAYAAARAGYQRQQIIQF
jgi:hypothetical protein